MILRLLQVDRKTAAHAR